MMRSRTGGGRRKAQSWQPHPQRVPERHSVVHSAPPASRLHDEDRPMPENTPKQPAAAFRHAAPRHNGPDGSPVATTSPTGVSHV